MATIGLDKLFYAKITEDNEGIESYGTPSQLAKAMTADLSVELAEATIRTIDDDYDVVMWEKHGIFAVDTDVMSAFDQVDVLNKAAQIYISAKNMGFEPDGMTREQMREISEVFHLPK